MNWDGAGADVLVLVLPYELPRQVDCDARAGASKAGRGD